MIIVIKKKNYLANDKWFINLRWFTFIDDRHMLSINIWQICPSDLRYQ